VAFLVYALIWGLYLSWISRARSFQGIPEVSYSWVTLSMPFGSALLLVTAFLKIREEMRSDPADGPEAPRAAGAAT
jgi:TRAP-type C4-dicarboxylate transport system permease small subunit